MGTVRRRQGVGDGPGGLLRRRAGLDVVPARPRAVADLPLERGRPGRDLRPDQLLCLGLALWNGVDPILKERAFGLTGPEGNHGEDVKEYWWQLDATPTHSWMRWRYHYPQRAFPYDDLVAENRARGQDRRSTSSLDTGPSTTTGTGWSRSTYAKARPDDICLRIEVANDGPEAATLHVLPTAVVPQHLGLGAAGREAVAVDPG